MLTETVSTAVEETGHPELMQGVGSWLFFKGRSTAEDIYIVGSIAVDRYLTVPVSKLPAVWSFMKRLDGSRTLDRIARELLTEEGLKIDVRVLHRKFRRAGLLVDGGSRRIGDIEEMSATVARLPLDSLLHFLRRLSFAAVPALYLVTLVILGAAAVIVLDPSFLNSVKRPGTAGQPYSWNAFSTAAIVILSVLAHELSHCFAAAALGISRGTVRVQLYLGVIPIVGLKLGGLYTLPPRARMAVWGAGVFTNLGIAAGALLLIGTWLPGSAALRVALTFNWVITVWNLMPLLPTDGYFLLSTMVKDSNVRVRAWTWLRRPLRRSATRPSWFVFAYVASTVWLLVSTLWGLLRRAFNLGARYPAWESGLALVMLLLFVVMLWRNFRKSEEFD